MPRYLPSLNALKAFEAAGRHQNFTLAANELFVTQGAISRQVKQLEEYLGFPLFERRGQTLQLTAAGKQYLGAIKEALDTMDEATQSIIQQFRPNETLTISVLPSLSSRWLIPKINQFKQQHPHLQLNIITSDNTDALFEENVDIVIRSGKNNNWSRVDATWLMNEELIPICSPDLLQKNYPINTADDFHHYTLLEHTSRKHMWRNWFKQHNSEEPTEKRLGFEHYFMLIQAAHEKLGIALVPRFLIEQELISHSLVSPIPTPCTSQYSYYLITRKMKQIPQKISLFKEWILLICQASSTSN
ncbi:transcriptional regulator GcvA [Spartinivicinus poritis]|uniref:Transcriptional regulator GcvA n=1 Tax=Spartinivicinus poritis TaxID=2994640 RepID=A0ABT5UG66_9GAMM|nr:transcriptional regulator GcvA [Spartinivicinus sp. A2-2]MDE1465384.1 transcriptional regulator GcvA [Spartinivicinus sp. A2-2]